MTGRSLGYDAPAFNSHLWADSRHAALPDRTSDVDLFPRGLSMSMPTTIIPGQDRALPVAVGAGLTNRGMVRDRNEDSILTDPSGTLWAVADGMGGYGNGDVASDIVIDCLAKIPDGVEPGPALVARLVALAVCLGAPPQLDK